MIRKFNKVILACILTATISLSGCGTTDNSSNENTTSISEQYKTTKESNTETASTEDNSTKPAKTNSSESEPTTINSNITVTTDLALSQGLEFETNGDGTCTITGIGTCTDTDIVIPTESPYGDTVTLINERAFFDLDDVDSPYFPEDFRLKRNQA